MTDLCNELVQEEDDSIEDSVLKRAADTDLSEVGELRQRSHQHLFGLDLHRDAVVQELGEQQGRRSLEYQKKRSYILLHYCNSGCLPIFEDQFKTFFKTF